MRPTAFAGPTIALALIVAFSPRGQADVPPETPDLTPAVVSFSNEVKAAKRARNDIRIARAVEEFNRELAKYQGMVVRCDFGVIAVKSHRVLFDNPALTDRARYFFVISAADAASLAGASTQDLVGARDQVIVAGIRQPLPFNERLASISQNSAASLAVGGRVVITGKLLPTRVDPDSTQFILFADARVVEP